MTKKQATGAAFGADEKPATRSRKPAAKPAKKPAPKAKAKPINTGAKVAMDVAFVEAVKAFAALASQGATTQVYDMQYVAMTISQNMYKAAVPSSRRQKAVADGLALWKKDKDNDSLTTTLDADAKRFSRLARIGYRMAPHFKMMLKHAKDADKAHGKAKQIKPKQFIDKVATAIEKDAKAKITSAYLEELQPIKPPKAAKPDNAAEFKKRLKIARKYFTESNMKSTNKDFLAIMKILDVMFASDDNVVPMKKTKAA